MQSADAARKSRVDLANHIARKITLLLLGILVAIWTLQSILSVRTVLSEIDVAQQALAQSFAGRALDRMRQIESRLADTIATVELMADGKDIKAELRRALRLERTLVSLTYRSARGGLPVSIHRDGADYSVRVPNSQRHPFGVGRLALGYVEFQHELGPQVPFIFSMSDTRKGGEIHGTLSLTAFSELISEFPVELSSSIFIALPDGTVVAHRSIVLAMRGTQMPETQAPTGGLPLLASRTLNDSWIARASQGELRLMAKSQIGTSGWTVFFGRPLLSAVNRALNLQVFALYLLILMAVAAVFTSRFVGKVVSRPIVDLRNAVTRGHGQHTLAIPASLRNDEIGELGTAFATLVHDLSQSRESLEIRVREKTLDLAAANQQLAVSSQHKSDFLAHMSHELRTPLNAVIGFSEMLKAQYFGPLNDKQAEYVRDINASGQHLLSLINDILDLAKVEAGRMELVRSDVHLPSLVEACCSLVSERFARKSQTLNTVVDSTVSFWSLDERKVKQCVLNLLSNANKFTPQGGRVSLLVAAEDNALVVRVTDTGVGIAPDALTNLFTEFYQVAPSSAAAGGAATAQSTDAREGTGLGLALTKKFVELHGGTVEVASEVGKGSTFTLRFPAVNGSGAEQAVAS